ncbi:HlyD family efflux transporter periplasmic adaptor subunit [Oscillibacter sp.]|uniref:HlyD family efflux transporter periplasmic adaptor subunit n=1 Tax=Oscillibacter sp. TaxID=1945593 RepID=UPI0026038ED5|nr:HlyD family efflux transporter periplasmic adaptor subunit [Oscillibacter sp.]MDD3347776.1 HlyD family efflux transporter periplasmic adaptor subunit [Oscillibacter sp.]
MKNRALGSKLLMAAVTLAVLAYFGIEAFRYFDDPLTTALAYAYEVEEGTDLSGYVVRREQVLADDASGLLRLQRAEGERVSTGGTVATVYADQASLDRQNEMESLQTRLDQVQYAQEAALGSEASLKLDAQIMRNILGYRTGVTADRLYDAQEQGSQLRSLVLKRDYTYTDNEDLSAQITELQTQLKTLKSQAANSVRRITAPSSGLYSAVVDGFETVLTPESLSGLTPSALSALRADESVHSQVGKLILGDAWYYAATMRASAAQELSEAAAELERAGKNLSLRFAKGVERDLPVTVDAVGPEENGRVVVTFRGRSYLPQLTLLRQQSAQVIRTTYSGIRVPKEALRATRTMQDSEGARTTEECLGLYCVVGVEARFKPVEVLYNGDGFVLVRTAEGSTEGTRLRPGDTVIIAANDLYDGKIVT